jgi:anaerobic selenocysteine-containing dehydrogenase
MFLEYDDLYLAYGQTHITVGPRILDRYEECRTNHELICQLAKRLGANHPSFEMSAVDMLDATLRASGRGTWEEAKERGWLDCAQSFEKEHFLDGFPSNDGRFHFKPNWAAVGPYHTGMTALPVHRENVEQATDELPFRLIVPPARTFLNTTFTETPGSIAREVEPRAVIHPDDAARLGVVEGTLVRIGNERGEVSLRVRPLETAKPGVVVVEGNWPSDAYPGRVGVNVLIGADPVPPSGGAAFHDTAIWLRAA